MIVNHGNLKINKTIRVLLILLSFTILFGQASAAIQPVAAAETNNSVILMIGDGMGPEQVEFGRLVEYGPSGESAIQSFPYENTVGTDNIDGTTTDSAASGTAISSGVKTKNGRIGVNFDASVELTTILEICESNSYKTGLIATCHMTHATPAAFAAHDADRGNYNAIAEDMAASGVDLLMGGGNSTDYFGNEIADLQSNGYDYVQTITELESASTLPLLGLFDSGSLSKEENRDNETVPSLSEMVEKGINMLDSAGDPFFLMVEGSQIDWAGHASDKQYLAHEMVEFEKAVRVARSYATQKTNVQLLVTADHECGGLSIDSYSFSTDLPQPGDSLTENRTTRNSRASEIGVSWIGMGGHTKTKVPLVGMGPYTSEIESAEHHVDTFSIMRQAVDGATEPGGSGWYDGYIDPIWFYSIGGVAAAAVIIFVIYKKKASASAGNAS